MKGVLFTYGLTYGGALVALFNPFYGLLIYIAFAIIRPEAMWFWSVPVGNYSRIVAVTMLVGWAFRGFGNWRFGRAWPIVCSFIGLYGWALLSAVVVAHNIPAALDWLEMIGKILLPFLVGMTMIENHRQLNQLAWVLLLSLAYVALEMNLAYNQGWNRMLQGFGPFDNNVLSIAMAGGIGFAFFLGVASRTIWGKAVGVLAALLMAHSIMFAFSRGGMLGMCAVAIIMFFLVPKSPKNVLVAVLAVVIGYRLMGREVMEEFLSVFVDPEVRDTSAQSRLDLWGQCWTLMTEHPLLGVGPDNWGDYARDRFGWGTRKEAHSLWMQTGAELGFVGLGLLLSFYGTCVWRLAKELWHHAKTPPHTANYARMVIASLVGFSVSVSFVSAERLEVPYYTVLVGAVALKLISRDRDGLPQEHAATQAFDSAADTTASESTAAASSRL